MKQQELSRCPLCESKHVSEFTTEFATVRKCGNPSCGHLYAIKISPSSGIHEHDEDNIALFERRNQRLIHKLLDSGYIKDHSRVLDIGSGLGHIMKELKRQAPCVDVICVEAAPKSVAYLKKSGFTVIEDIKHLDPSKYGFFDIIFMVELIEHIEKPIELLTACKRMLASRGRIFLTTPCGELRNGSHNTSTYQIREHIQFFTEQSLRLAVLKAGFQHVKYKELREYHAGSDNRIIKWIKDSARILRNRAQGPHHLIAYIW